MVTKYDCVHCHKQVAATKGQRYRSHKKADGSECGMSSLDIPEHILAQPVGEDDRPDVPREGVDFAVCASCDRKVKLTQLGYFEPHNTTLLGGERCPTSGVRAKHAKKVVDVNLPEPAATSEPATANPSAADVSAGASLEEPAKGNLERYPMESVDSAESGASTDSNSPESGSTSTAWPPYDGPPSLYGVKSGRFWQPESPYLQPPEYTGPEKPEPMTGLAQDLAIMIKETFYSYSNRRTSDNRTAQATLGPSEIGTPCDRRLAMELMDVPYVNPGGDGWASWLGTQGHDGMAKIYTFANAGTGRYAIEFPVYIGNQWVPRGTSDLFDRKIFSIIDWKFMGAYSLKKFKLEGPSETYEVQGHVYGLGAERAGEKVKNVAIVGLPRAGSSLDEMHVHVMPYDRKRALAALKRVDDIASRVGYLYGNVAATGEGPASALEAAATFDTADDCRYCPFFRKNDTEMTKGCPGI